MTLITIVRHVPPPLVGVCGVLPERRFEAFERDLDWLESTGVLVERYEPDDHREGEAPRQAIAQVLASEGARCLPLILVNEAVVSRGVYPTRAHLARLADRGQPDVRLDVARQLAVIGAAAALGAHDELRRQMMRARELGIGDTRTQAAIHAGVALCEARRSPSPAA